MNKFWRAVSGLAEALGIKIGSTTVFSIDSLTGVGRVRAHVPVRVGVQSVDPNAAASDTLTLTWGAAGANQAQITGNVIVPISAGTIVLTTAASSTGVPLFFYTAANVTISISGGDSASIVAGQGLLAVSNGTTWALAKLVAPS